MSEYEETDSLTLAVAKAMADHSLWPGAFDTMMRREGWSGSGAEANVWIGYAEAAIGAFYDFHAKPLDGDVFEETEEDSRKRRGLDDAYEAGRSDGAEEALRAAMARRDFP